MNLSEEAETMKRAGLSVQLKKCSHLFETEQEMLLVQPVYYLQIHAYMNALQFFADSLGVQIYEQSRVIGAEADGVYTEQGSIQAPYLLVATGYPVINTPGWFFLRLEQRCIRRQHINAEINHPLMAEDGSWKLIPKGNKALLQYTDGIVGTDNAVQSFSFPREWKDAMIHHGSNAGIDTFSEDGLPYIGRYSSKTPHLYVGAGYGGDGLAGSMIAAQTISASILGLPASGYDLYQPQRMIKSAKMSINIGKRYIQGMFGGTEVPRCSHMGCKLVYNVSSRLWECPCHGSRFDEIGRVENAPAARPAALGGRKSKGR